MEPRPYRLQVEDSVLEDLQMRLRRVRFPPALQFQAAVDGVTIHFIRKRGKGDYPLPLLLVHGYPDSFLRFTKLIPLLADPPDASDSFEVVVPSLPGYAFSGPLPGGGIFAFGKLFHQLMTRELGYARYGTHGGDWGGVVVEQLARSHAHSLAGVHLTDVPFWHAFQKPSKLSEAEAAFFAANEKWQRKEGAIARATSSGASPRTICSPTRCSTGSAKRSARRSRRTTISSTPAPVAG
jgi:microsomal epoxide hydrolase